ncbi:MAG: hypothetical protein D6675_01140 [Gemmatimonadetes bacterium]|nr:MAG: hypothetical protein D6675_01140 [Gemmatimonadota bacterium]
MANGYKFGTFAGVFTPSILTILGVIMYLRLGWVVGQAGIIGAIGIILIAHIISVSTGLSVSSIATDKRVKAGGVYYIISRSLGLSIGGALGIALYAGTAVSIALYIVGFAESFNEAFSPLLDSFFGITLGTTKADLRLTGSLTLLVVTTLAFISTSLALKSQFLVLGLIALSLVSIFLGSHDFVPTHVNLFAPAESRSFAEVFGIFFPAVTGFTAGIAMSGDLKDPNKSIPVGTMAAVGTGLVIYISLAIFLGLTVDGEVLRTDYNILKQIAWWSPLVLGGIWAATISSAMGGILGAPRILQALSMDRVTPKLFGIGFGEGNEPRNALIFTAIIAEIAIWSGELDLIARIVSMFYMTTYGFLNLTYAIESWASPDFRPEFKIPTWVSVVGAVVCFLFMILLDVVAMIASSLIMIGIFFYLKRKELGTDAGDVWAGVWFTVVRSGLFKLNQSDLHKRNWQPNVILFSGGTDKRPHLLQFGKWLVQNRGVLSNFDLIEDTTTKVLFSKSNQALKTDPDEFTGIFMRRQTCRNIYDGIDMIVRSYGFSGIEPNTVLMGWVRNSRNPARFVDLLHTMTELDYNLLLLDYDDRFGYGKRQQIDIWWRGSGNNISLSLMLVKFMRVSDEWRDALIRVMIVNEDSSLTPRIIKNMGRVLEEYRIPAEVKVINNAIEKRSFRDLIKLESVHSDLTIIGMPDVNPQNVDQFIANTNWLLHEIGTVLLIRASSYFEEIFVGIERKQPKLKDDTTPITEFQLPALIFPQNDALERALRQLAQQLEDLLRDYIDCYLKEMYGADQQLIGTINQLIQRTFTDLEKQVSTTERLRQQKVIPKIRNNFLFQARRILTEFKTDYLPDQKEMAEAGITWIFSQMTELAYRTPETLNVGYELERFAIQPEDSLRLKLFKWQKARLNPAKVITQDVRLRDLKIFYVETKGRHLFYQILQEFGVDSYQNLYQVQRLLEQAKSSLSVLDRHLQTDEFSPEVIAAEREKLKTLTAQTTASHQEKFNTCRHTLLRESRHILQRLIQDADRIDVNQFIRRQRRVPKSAQALRDQILNVPSLWLKNQYLVLNVLLTDLVLASLQSRMRMLVQKMMSELNQSVQKNISENFQELTADLEQLRTHLQEKTDYTLPVMPELRVDFDIQEAMDKLVAEIQEVTGELPETVEVMSGESLNMIENRQFDRIEVLTISLRRLVDYLIATEFVRPLQAVMAELPLKLSKALGTTSDVLRMVSLHLSDLEIDLETVYEATVQKITDGIRIIQSEREQIEKILNILNEATQRHLKQTFEKINLYFITHSTGVWGQYMQHQVDQAVPSKFQEQLEQLYRFGREVLVKLWYHQSRNLSRTRGTSPLETAGGKVESMLALVDTISPPKRILAALPFYYKQLFIGKPTISTEFWIGATAEIARAEQAVRRFRSGIAGGLAIIGERYSGKTALSLFIAHQCFDTRRVYRIDPPQGGSIELAVFETTVQHAVASELPYSDIFNTLPAHSVFVFNDLDMWWERSAGGMVVVNRILQLMTDYGDKYFFILNLNHYSYNFINALRNLDHLMLEVISCPPFDAEQLKDLILRRHRSTGLTFQLDGHDEKHLAEWKQARLFTEYFKYSRGNPGVALQAWIANIQEIQNETLIIRKPVTPDLKPLNLLEPDWILILIQFILHKKLTRARLARILRRPPERWKQDLTTLKRMGIVTENTYHILEINPFLHPYLVRKLKEMEVL